jgi:hypothetical protein
LDIALLDMPMIFLLQFWIFGHCRSRGTGARSPPAAPALPNDAMVDDE